MKMKMLTTPKVTKKPWGEEQLFALTPLYAGKLLYIRKGHRLSLQYHLKKTESLYVLRGVLKLTLKKNKKLSEMKVTPGMMFHVPPKTVHRMEAVKNCVLIEVSTPELLDVVRLSDDYMRETKHG